MIKYQTQLASLPFADAAQLELFHRAKYDLVSFAEAAKITFHEAAIWFAQPAIAAAVHAMEALNIQALIRVANEARLACMQILLDGLSEAETPAQRRSLASTLLRASLRPLGSHPSIPKPPPNIAAPKPEPSFTPRRARKSKSLLIATAEALYQGDAAEPNAGLATIAANLSPGASADNEPIPSLIASSEKSADPTNTALPNFQDFVEFAHATPALELFRKATSWSSSNFTDRSDQYDQIHTIDIDLYHPRPDGKRSLAHSRVRLEAKRETRGTEAGCWFIHKLTTLAAPPAPNVA